jgi:hypothetical protein
MDQNSMRKIMERAEKMMCLNNSFYINYFLCYNYQINLFTHFSCTANE